MGEFLPVEQEGDVGKRTRYPGYAWRHSGSEEIGFEKQDESGLEIV